MTENNVKEILCGKRINSSVLKSRCDKRRTSESLRQQCDQFSKGTTNCPTCGNGRSTTLTEIYGFSYVECVGCSLVYISNPPTADEIERLYNSEFYSDLEQTLYGDPKVSECRVEHVATPKVQYIRKLPRQGDSFKGELPTIFPSWLIGCLLHPCI